MIYYKVFLLDYSEHLILDDVVPENELMNVLIRNDYFTCHLFKFEVN